jgi:predicted DCC family thiol-disulfide oxidoreductase YuxK
MEDSVRQTLPREEEPTPGDIVFFDGVCNLCNGVVQFILDRDSSAAIRFAALQSKAAAELLLPLGVSVVSEAPDSVILLTSVDGVRVALQRSDAVLAIARKLGFPWPLLYWAGILWPRFARDAIYKFVARHRYGWFGKTESCRVPTPELKARFLV